MLVLFIYTLQLPTHARLRKQGFAFSCKHTQDDLNTQSPDKITVYPPQPQNKRKKTLQCSELSYSNPVRLKVFSTGLKDNRAGRIIKLLDDCFTLN